MRLLVVLLSLSFIAGSVSAQEVAAVISFNTDVIKIYDSREGDNSEVSHSVKKFLLPAAQMSSESDYGMILVDLRFKDDPDKGVRGWVQAEDIEVDTRRAIDVKSDCARSLASGTTSRSSTRGLGEKC